jgi:hypothetical protein
VIEEDDRVARVEAEKVDVSNEIAIDHHLVVVRELTRRRASRRQAASCTA